MPASSETPPSSDTSPPSAADLRTDQDWEEWGRRDPYFSVLTKPKFRKKDITADAKEDFFLSGHMHVNLIMNTIRNFVTPNLAPKRILDFGCGVGRMVIPFAKIADQVVGADVSPSMLQVARENCDERGLTNVSLVLSDDSLALGDGQFDMIHSFIVFQHIPPGRGVAQFSKLLGYLAPGGVAAIHFLYSKAKFASTRGSPPPPDSVSASPKVPPAPDADPEMQMNPYPATELLFMLQTSGIPRSHIQFTNHGKEFGIFLFFEKPLPDEHPGKLMPY